MRIKKALLGVISIVIAQILMLIGSLIIKKIFLEYIPISYLGLTGLFNTFFSSLELVNMAFSSLVIYNLYKPLNEGDTNKICEILSYYRSLFRYVSIFVLITSLLFLPFINSIFKIEGVETSAIYYVYIIQMAATTCRIYFLHKIVVLKASQNEYLSTFAAILIDISANILRYIFIVYLRSFELYFLTLALYPVTIQLCEWVITKKNYGEVMIYKKITMGDVLKSEYLKQATNFVFRILFNLIYFAMDNIIISILFGTIIIGYMSNYSSLIATLTQVLFLVGSILKGIMANYKYSENDKKGYYNLFDTLNIMNYVVTVSVSCVFIFGVNGFISLWIGSEYLIDKSITFMLVMIMYLTSFGRIMENVFEIEGYVLREKIPLIIAILANLIFSVLLGNLFGVIGILIGTFSSYFIYIGGKLYYLSKYIFSEQKQALICKQITLLLCGIIQMFLVFIYMNNFTPLDVGSLIGGCLIIIWITAIINVIIFFRRKEYDLCKNAVLEMLKVVERGN